MTKREFTIIAAKSVLELFSELKFEDEGNCAFGRRLGPLRQGFGLNVDRSVISFCVPVGVDVPALWRHIDYVNQGHYPASVLGHRLGEFLNRDCTAKDTWYNFKDETELRSVIRKTHTDFVQQALPWLERFQTVEDVANEFYRWGIHETWRHRWTYGRRPPDPFRWATYGWLLEEMQRHDEAENWLRKAFDYLSQRGEAKPPPPVIKGGVVRFVPTPSSEAEQRLMELLRQSLKMPIADTYGS